MAPLRLRRGRRGQEDDQSPRGFGLARRRADRRRERGHDLDRGRQRPEDVDPLEVGKLRELLEAELMDALREGLAALSARCRELLLLLIQDPPLAYADVGTRLQLPVGSIGPTRGRCLEALRRTPALAALNSAGTNGEEAQHVAR